MISYVVSGGRLPLAASTPSIYLSGLVTAVAVFRNPNTIPFCFFYSIKIIFFGSVIATLQHCGRVEVKVVVGVVSKEQVDIMITVWLLNFGR
jgi:hypothetical protein